VSVGTVKKSIAAITSRWLLRNVFHPASITKPGCTSHPARDRSLGDIKSKLQQFTVNPGCIPGRILGDHPENQFAQFPADSPSADLVAATPAPIAAKSSSMPAHHRLRSDDHKGALPLRPDLVHADPEQPIERCQLWSVLAAFENGKLLTKGQILQQKIFTGTKAATQQADQKPQHAEHGPDLHQMPTVRLTAMSLNSKPDRILAKHSWLLQANPALARAISSAVKRAEDHRCL